MNVNKVLGSWGAVCSLLLGAIVLSGCETTPPFTEFPPAGQTGVVSASRGPGPDVIQVGDSLTIIFSDLVVPLPAFEVRVNEEGKITLVQNQTFDALGKSRPALEREIRERYVPAIFKNLTVTILPKDLFYNVNGEVKQPSRQVYLGPTTVLKAIGSAGDFTDFSNKRRVQLIRGDRTIETINCIKALKDASLDLPVYPGDTVHVPRRLF